MYAYPLARTNTGDALSVQIQPQFLCHLHICGHIVVAVVVAVVVAIVAGFYCVNLQVVLALPVCVCWCVCGGVFVCPCAGHMTTDKNFLLLWGAIIQKTIWNICRLLVSPLAHWPKWMRRQWKSCTDAREREREKHEHDRLHISLKYILFTYQWTGNTHWDCEWVDKRLCLTLRKRISSSFSCTNFVRNA